uniref:Uncharacterized protein n=1 Tax=Rhizophora mucronata TaxID=61149 RepID=A0A2P2KAP8_RHIMU
MRYRSNAKPKVESTGDERIRSPIAETNEDGVQFPYFFQCFLMALVQTLEIMQTRGVQIT